MTKLVIENPTESVRYMLESMGCVFREEVENDETTVIATPPKAETPTGPHNVRHFDTFTDLIRASGMTQSAFAKAVGCSS